jgi:hypothetical protein
MLINLPGVGTSLAKDPHTISATPQMAHGQNFFAMKKSLIPRIC